MTTETTETIAQEEPVLKCDGCDCELPGIEPFDHSHNGNKPKWEPLGLGWSIYNGTICCPDCTFSIPIEDRILGMADDTITIHGMALLIRKMQNQQNSAVDCGQECDNDELIEAYSMVLQDYLDLEGALA